MKLTAPLFFVIAAISADGLSQPAGIGNRLAKESIALVSFVELGNIGSRDPDCRGVSFHVADPRKVVADEIAPLFRALARMDRAAKSSEVDATIRTLESIPTARSDVLEAMYKQKKLEATTAYGISGRCASLSTMVTTSIHQKRLSLKEIATLLP